ncbi:curved DNA-binding protein [Aurantivibrio plasticivorans]
MEFKDYYKTLGVDDNADTKAIKTAYRKLARKYHPDVSEEHDAEDKFKEVTEAYEVLGDAKKRAEYDEIRQYGTQGGGFQPPPGWQPGGGAGGFDFSGAGAGGGNYYEGDFSEFFENIFGGGFRQQGGQQGPNRSRYSSRGRDIELEMPIFLEDTLKEGAQQISYKLPHYSVDGQRLEDVKKTLNVKIPTGVADGEVIRLKGQGAQGVGDGPSGDLFLKIRLVPHPQFDVEGHNLIITVPLLPWEAALGAKVTVPTLEGKIQLTVAANSQSGQRLRIKGKGLPHKTGRGDLIAVLNVVMPKTTSDATKEAWEALAKHNTENPRADWN